MVDDAGVFIRAFGNHAVHPIQRGAGHQTNEEFRHAV
jgi:hypothetical protein